MRPRNKGKFDHNFFSKIDIEKKAYWLGFLMADGTINDKIKSGALQVSLHLATLDLNDLKKFVQCLQSKNKICLTKSDSVRSSHSSDILCNDLIKLGCTPRKSLTLKFPTEEQVPPHLVRHFIRGYFDGDGSTCIHKNRLFIDFLGTENFLHTLSNYLPIKKVVKLKSTNLYVLTISDIKGCRLLYEYMYKDATIYLERKKARFETWLEIERPSGTGKYDHIFHRKIVLQKDKNNFIIKEWDSLTEAGNTLGIGIGDISTVCKGKQKTAGGFIWEYKT